MPEPDDDGAWPSPSANPDLIGHAEVEAQLLSAFGDRRLHHAWLITGPEGIGKATLAYRFARYILANGGAAGAPGLFGDSELAEEGGDGLYVAPEHPVFRRIAAGGHADQLVIERSLNDRGTLRTEIVVDDVRRIGHFVHMTAGEGGWRIIIVDSADELNPNAANALLKVLEEPPPKALLLLVSHNPGRLLPTIRSRCQVLRLDALAADAVAERLASYLPDLTPAEAQVVAVLAEGSIGRALELAGTGGVGVYGEIMGLLEGLPRLDVPELHGFAGKCASKSGETTFQAASDLLRWTLARLVKHAGGAEQGELTDRERALFDRLAGAAGLDRWLQVWEKVDDILASADRANLDRKQVILNAFSTVAQVVHG